MKVFPKQPLKVTLPTSEQSKIHLCHNIVKMLKNIDEVEKENIKGSEYELQIKIVRDW